MKINYINIGIELLLSMICSTLFWFAVDTRNTISITNNSGKRIVNDSVARSITILTSASIVLFSNYCLIKDLNDQ